MREEVTIYPYDAFSDPDGRRHRAKGKFIYDDGSRVVERLPRCSSWIMGLQQAVDRGFGHEVALLVGKAHGQLPQGEFGLLERQLDDPIMDGRWDAVPYSARGGRPIGQRVRAALKVTIIPVAKGPARDAQLLQRPSRRQVRLLDDPDDLELLGCGIPVPRDCDLLASITTFMDRRPCFPSKSL